MTGARPPSNEPSALRQVRHRGRYFPQKTSHRPQGSQDAGAIPAWLKGLPRMTSTPDAILCSVLSTATLHCSPTIRGKTMTSEISHICTPPLPVSIKGGGMLLPNPLSSSSSLSIHGLTLATRRTHTRSPELDIGTCLNHPSRDLGASLPLSPCLYSPTIGTQVLDNTVHSHTPAGRTAP